MSVFSYHIARTARFAAVRSLLSPPLTTANKGLIHAECMTTMKLGSGIFSPSRLISKELVVFAQWENEEAIDRFLSHNPLGATLVKGWHIRLQFLRQWGKISGFNFPAPPENFTDEQSPVVAVTLARMKLPEVPRFIRWGRPVEKLVRDHPGTTMSLASLRLPRTVSTFSIWKSQKEMTDMVSGHSKVPDPARHINAMKERDRKDFHFEFTTLRFKPLSEHGSWNGIDAYIPSSQPAN